MDLGIEGRTALITGAGRGIGAEIARTLAAEGVRIAVNDLFRNAPTKSPTTSAPPAAKPSASHLT